MQQGTRQQWSVVAVGALCAAFALGMTMSAASAQAPPASQPAGASQAATRSASPPAAQSANAPPAASAPASRPAPASTLQGIGAGPHEPPLPPPGHAVRFWPPLEGPALTWFAVIVVLVLSIRFKPLLCERNLDGLLLAATCLLLALRTDTLSVSLPARAGGHTGQWWAYLLLTLAAAYWLIRGLYCLLSPAVPRHESQVSRSAVFILALAGLAIGVHQIATAPLAPASRDGLVGGLYMAQTGKLPYGEALGHDARSPLLYVLHAGAVKAVPPTTADVGFNRTALTTTTKGDRTEISGSGLPVTLTMSWQNRGSWLTQPWWEQGDFAAARLVSGLLFVLLLLALYAIGAALHSPVLGLTLITIFCVFPGSVECLSQPEIMLPTALLGWSVAFALVPGVGGLLSGVLIVLAGLAWPWAWLALPVLLAYFLRHGWEAIGGLVGTVAGVAVSLAGLLYLTAPSLPRADGALARSDQPPAYLVSRTDDGRELEVAPRVPGAALATGWLRPFWSFLVSSESLVLDTAAAGPGLTPVRTGMVDARKLLYQRLEPTDAAREELTQRYRAALQTQPAVTRMWVALRTVLEQTWLANPPPASGALSVWALWGVGAANASQSGPLLPKLVRLGAGLLAIAVAVVILRRRRPLPHHLIGGLLVVSSATLLASGTGSVSNLVWLMPAVLALWAVHEEPAPVRERPTTPLYTDLDSGPPPRISVER